MPEQQRRAPSDGLTDQERGYVRSRDPGLALLTDITKVLSEMRYDKGAAQELLDELVKERAYYAVTPPVHDYELPSEIEEVLTLRSARFEIQLISGLHETVDEGYISLVLLAVPLMGWEVMRLDEELIGSGAGPGWAKGWTDGDIETFQLDNDDAWSEHRPQARELVPLMAKAVEDPFEDETGYARRREALLGALRILCTRFPFKVFFSESGNIPKEVPDEWIGPEILVDYSKRKAVVEERLAKTPNDPNLLYEKASLLMGRDDLKEAEVLLDRAINIEPNLPFVWFALSDLYSRSDRDEDADTAEAKGAELEKVLDGRWPSRPDVWDFTPSLGRFPDDTGDEEGGGDPLRCPFCDGDFLLVTDGFWALCNKCNRSGPLEGKGLGLSLSVENAKPMVGEPIPVKVFFENRTGLEMTYSTDDLEFISVPPSDEVSDDGEEDSPGDHIADWIGKLRAPFATGVIAPHGKAELSVDLRKLETLQPIGEGDEDKEVEGVFDRPGEHRVSVYLKVTAGPIEDGREPWAETDPVRIIVKRK